jgi:hypothetical protein
MREAIAELNRRADRLTAEAERREQRERERNIRAVGLAPLWAQASAYRSAARLVSGES